MLPNERPRYLFYRSFEKRLKRTNRKRRQIQKMKPRSGRPQAAGGDLEEIELDVLVSVLKRILKGGILGLQDD
jgi:hypothetical protein